MDDIKSNRNGEAGECPKRVFRLLSRPAVKPAPKGEDPKQFLRRIAPRAQMQNLNPIEVARAQ